MVEVSEDRHRIVTASFNSMTLPEYHREVIELSPEYLNPRTCRESQIRYPFVKPHVIRIPFLNATIHFIEIRRTVITGR
jgi:hypothetical protein